MSEIDVSKCDYYFQGRCGVSKNINYSIGCYANDCYYKQLQQVIKDRDYYKQIVDGCKSENGNCSFCEIDKQLQQLKAENEELKKLNEQLVTYYPQENNELLKVKQENEELRSDNSMLLAQGDADAFVISNLNFKIQKLQQCLDEIEKIATVGYEGFCPKCSKKDCEDNNCYETAIIDILEKIKEVKGNEKHR